MFISETTCLYARDDDEGPGLTKQNIIIIAVCASVAFLVLAFALFRLIRNCRRSSKAAPLPPPQPLAHQREQLALFEQSAPRVTTWYQPPPADHRIRSNSLSGSKASLLGKESPGLSPSIPPSTESMQDLEVPSRISSHHLPLPNSSFYPPVRPSSRSSFNSSDASCAPPPSSAHSFSPDSTTPPYSSPARFSRSPRPRHARPLSMSSTYTYGTTISRGTSRVRGVPHAPHNQIQIVLPTPLASANNSRDSLAMPRGRIGSGAGDRRSVADAWINLSSGAYDLAHRSTESLPETVPKTPRRRPASMSASTSPVLYEGQAMIPPVPRLPENGSVESASLSHSPQAMQRSETKGRKLEKRRIQS